MAQLPRKNKTVCITGGTGSFGRAMTARLLSLPDGPCVRVFSRDEDKQETMARDIPPGPRLTYILGDVRDIASLTTAFDNCEYVIHAAALKRVPQGERHSGEFHKTNVSGTQNVITAAIANNVRNSVFISSDKAVNPINHYGKTKAVAEGLFIQANLLGVSRGCTFAVVRGGNVWGSRGSVMEKWKTAVECDEPIVIYGGGQTRFHLPMTSWTEFVWQAATQMHGGEIFLPKLRAWRIEDLAAVYGARKIETFPARPGDKAHESMIGGDEGGRVKDIGWAYAIEPSPDIRSVWNYQEWAGWTPPAGFEYSSRDAQMMTAAELLELVK